MTLQKRNPTVEIKSIKANSEVHSDKISYKPVMQTTRAFQFVQVPSVWQVQSLQEKTKRLSADKALQELPRRKLRPPETAVSL